MDKLEKKTNGDGWTIDLISLWISEFRYHCVWENSSMKVLIRFSLRYLKSIQIYPNNSMGGILNSLQNSLFQFNSIQFKSHGINLSNSVISILLYLHSLLFGVLLCLLSCGFSHSSHPLNIPIVNDLSMYLRIYCHFHDFLHLLYLNLDSHTYKAPNDTQRQILLLLLLLLNCSGFSIYQFTGSWKPYKRAFSQLRATAVHRHLGRFALSTRKMGPNIEKVGPK